MYPDRETLLSPVFASRYVMIWMSSHDTLFVDREAELSALERLWSQGGFGMFILYGRRRVGKTRLLREFCKQDGKKCVFYTCVPGPEELARDEFIDTIRVTLGIETRGRDFVEVLESLSKELRLSGERAVVVLDEFQYLASSAEGLVERLQRSIDQVLGSDGSLLLVLCGSAVSFMESEVLGYRSPLYGRRAGSLKLRPLRPFQVAGFYPGWSLRRVVEAYGVLGGTPAYHRFFDPRKDLWENVRESILTPGTYLYDEAVNLLRQEVREPRTYFSILSGVASGRTSQAELAGLARVDSRTIGKYLELLEGLDIVRRIAPAGRKKPVQVRFADNYFRFWFTYVKPHQGILEAGLIDEVLETIKSSWQHYMGMVLEDVILESIAELRRAGIVKPRPEKYGRWWRSGDEIDLVVWNGESAQFVEVKWGTLAPREAERILEKLREKSKKTGVAARREYYTLIAGKLEGQPYLEHGEEAVDLDDLGKLLGITRQDE